MTEDEKWLDTMREVALGEWDLTTHYLNGDSDNIPPQLRRLLSAVLGACYIGQVATHMTNPNHPLVGHWKHSITEEIDYLAGVLANPEMRAEDTKFRAEWEALR